MEGGVARTKRGRGLNGKGGVAWMEVCFKRGVM